MKAYANMNQRSIEFQWWAGGLRDQEWDWLDKLGVR